MDFGEALVNDHVLRQTESRRHPYVAELTDSLDRTADQHYLAEHSCARRGSGDDSAGSCRCTCPRSGQSDAAGDHADVTERLREVASELARRRFDLLGQQTERASSRTERGVQVLRLVEAHQKDQVFDGTEAAIQEGDGVAASGTQ